MGTVTLHRHAPQPDWVGALLALLLAASCGNQVDRNIDKLAAGGEDAEAAKMALSMARGSAVEPLIEAFEDRSHSASARADMADALFRLYLREKDERILTVLKVALADPEAPVRRAAIRSLGDLATTEACGALIVQLAREQDNGVRQEILVTLGLMGMDQGANDLDRRMTTRKMSDQERERFFGLLQEMREQDLPDSLRDQTLEWLEAAAEEKVVEAQNRVVRADLAGAEALLLAAHELVPDSRNVNQRLGRFYCENGQPAKGLALLTEIGAAIHVPPLAQAPRIDGVLDEGAWRGAAQITDFYQCVFRLRPHPITGRSQAYLGHRGGRLYIGIRGDEPTTENLATTARNRDEDAWRDDCVEIFLDPSPGDQVYYQVVVNSIGTFFDTHYDGRSPGGDRGWNVRCQHATHVDRTSWTLEIEIPLDQFGQAAPRPGTFWAANVARIRITNASEYGQWSPTYGSALRPDRFGLLVFD